jgi:hypothetical protein
MAHAHPEHDASGQGARRYLPALALAAVATVGAGTVAAAGPTTAGTSHSAQTVDSHRRMHFEVEFSPHRVIDTPPQRELQPGDYSVFSDRLLDRAGRVVGRQAGSGLVTKIRATGAQVYFSLAVKLAHGQIAVQGLSSTAPTKRMAVVGGTGRYTGADGHAILVERGDGTGTLTVTLRRPTR